MDIVCPTCDKRYRVSTAKLPKNKRLVAKCQNCGARIVVQGDRAAVDENARTIVIERRHEQESNFGNGKQDKEATGQFRFIPERQEFRGYAGFWKRAGAAVIDMVSLAIIGAFVGGFVGGIYAAITGTTVGTHILGRAVGILVGWMYYAIMESSEKQATLGKMAVGIKVTDSSGQSVSFARATARHFAKILSAIPLLLGYIAVAFTKKKQGLHDMISGCLVVNSR